MNERTKRMGKDKELFDLCDDVTFHQVRNMKNSNICYCIRLMQDET